MAITSRSFGSEKSVIFERMSSLFGQYPPMRLKHDEPDSRRRCPTLLATITKRRRNVWQWENETNLIEWSKEENILNGFRQPVTLLIRFGIDNLREQISMKSLDKHKLWTRRSQIWHYHHYYHHNGNLNGGWCWLNEEDEESVTFSPSSSSPSGSYDSAKTDLRRLNRLASDAAAFCFVFFLNKKKK